MTIKSFRLTFWNTNCASSKSRVAKKCWLRSVSGTLDQACAIAFHEGSNSLRHVNIQPEFQHPMDSLARGTLPPLVHRGEMDRRREITMRARQHIKYPLIFYFDIPISQNGQVSQFILGLFLDRSQTKRKG